MQEEEAMNRLRATIVASFVSIAFLAATETQAYPGGGHGSGFRGGSSTGSHGAYSGGWRGGSSHGYYRGGHFRHGYYFPLGIGVALAAPWYWGSYYYPYPYGYGPAYAYPAPYNEAPAYGYSIAPEEPSADIGPVSEPGAPLQHPLYLNYCASAKAYYPKVKSCAEGWQMARPGYQ